MVRLAYLAEKMEVDIAEIRSLLSELILEDKVAGQMDAIAGNLIMSAAEEKSGQKHRVMENWGNTLLSLHCKLTNRV